MSQIIPGAEPFHHHGDGTGCLLVHGFTGTPNEMRWLGEQLAADGRSVLGVRLAGHATTVEEMNAMRWPDWHASVVEGYRHLRRTCERVFIMGLSMGGMLAAHCAATERTQPPDGIVLMASPAHIRDWRITVFRPVQRFIPYWPKGRNAYVDMEMGERHIEYDRFPTAGVLSLLDLTKQMRADLPQVSVPALVICSKADSFADEQEARWVYERLGAREKRLVLLERSRHIVCSDIERETVLAEVRKFVVAG